MCRTMAQSNFWDLGGLDPLSLNTLLTFGDKIHKCLGVQFHNNRPASKIDVTRGRRACEIAFLTSPRPIALFFPQILQHPYFHDSQGNHCLNSRQHDASATCPSYSNSMHRHKSYNTCNQFCRFCFRPGLRCWISKGDRWELVLFRSLCDFIYRFSGPRSLQQSH